MENVSIDLFFLKMFKHEIANSINNLNGLARSVLNEPIEDKETLDDLNCDQAEAFDLSLITINKLNTLLYPGTIFNSNFSSFLEIFTELNKKLPLNPSKITLEPSALESIDQYPIEITTQILFSIFQLLIRTETDSIAKRQSIKVSIPNRNSLLIQFSEPAKKELFTDLSNGKLRYTTKSKMAFEYEYLRLLLLRAVFSLKIDDMTLLIALNNWDN